MAKLVLFPFFVVLFIVASVVAIAHVEYQVGGRVYCDNCRAGFITNITEYIEGATVHLQCKHYKSEKVEHNTEAVTGPDGYYKFNIPYDHEQEICYVKLVRSPRADCNEIEWYRNEARILLTENSGQANHVRYANSLGFLKDASLPICSELLKAYALDLDY